MDQEFYRRHSMPDMKDESGTASKTLSAAARRSFFRRKQKHKRSGSKDGKDLVDAISTDSLPIMEGEEGPFTPCCTVNDNRGTCRFLIHLMYGHV
ncbi:unnamed protein product [Oncorhynchus mykiss]|uniref:Uncharacterized protein n=1 Tax=Oncorhynchus mykiss TaxID=8022 RepID=A0A060VPQ9_ONCMY|nr:unnamed protein product [Oncorhynchus mykiss]